MIKKIENCLIMLVPINILLLIILIISAIFINDIFIIVLSIYLIITLFTSILVIIRMYLNRINCIKIYIELEINKNSDETNICCICLESLNYDIKILNCSHKYHKECIDIWLKKQKKCPCCRIQQ